MKLKNIIMLMIIFLFNDSIVAQQLHNNILIQDVKARQKDGMLNIEFKVDDRNALLSSQESIVLTPEVVSETKKKEFQPIVISGNTRYKADSRAKVFNTEYRNVANPFLSVRKNELSTIKYTQSIPFEDWMQNARIELKDIVYGCANCESEEHRTVLSNIEFEVIPKEEPVIIDIPPEPEPVKYKQESGEAYLDFPVGKSVILTDFRNNFKELSKILEVINQLRDNKDATITSIELTGFASPEGSYQTNNRLSALRAEALKTYLKDQYGYSSSLFSVSSTAEDWDGLRKLIEESNLSEKTELLSIINSTSSEDIKEQKLKSLPVYHTILTEFFPLLRRVEYCVNYTVPTTTEK